MKILVTGASGYIGRHVVGHLRSRNHDVVAVGRPTSGEKGGADVIEFDVLVENRHVFDELGRPDICIHLAWQDGFVHNSPVHFENVSRHYHFMRYMLEGGLRHLVGIGTMHEIGYYVGAVTDHTPTNPVTAYGIAKDYIRRAQALLCQEFGAVNQWLRCFYITGDDARNNSIFRKMLEAEAAGKTTFPMNSGEFLFDFIDVDELGSQIAAVATQTKITGIINCCSGEPVSLKTKVNDFIAMHGLKLRPLWGEFPARSYDSRAIWGDVSKLQAALAAGE